MIDATPHYILFSASTEESEPGRWRFVLRAMDGSDRFVAEDVEPDVHGERLELLALVRGLEALAQPSRVTLVTPSCYIRTGIRSGLSEWRRNGWKWEYFGQMVPVKHCDLWQRVDRALRFHKLECRSLRFDAAHEPYPVRSAAKDRAQSFHQGGGLGAEVPCCPTEGAETVPVVRGPHGPASTGVPSADQVSRWQDRATTGGRALNTTGGRDTAGSRERMDCDGRVGSFSSADRPDERGRFWRSELGLGKLFGLVKLLAGNRTGTLSPAAVCKEV